MEIEVRNLDIEWNDSRQFVRIKKTGDQVIPILEESGNFAINTITYQEMYFCIGFRILSENTLHTPYFVMGDRHKELLQLQDPETHEIWWIQQGVWLEDKNGSALADMGMIKDSSQFPPYNVGESVKVSGGSLFDAVISLRDAMLKGDHEAIGSRVLGTLDSGINNLTTRLAKNGSDYERAMNNIQRNQTTEVNVTQLVSREGDIDITKAITDLKMMEYVNQATMSNAGKMYQSSLLNYMR